ncbi:VOC family protein [Deinococcus yavapaiensis]|uniref:Glyoxylase I family protein n=1 Tax=Deinococcus yavapaiensis KR-236 TaxID=694435 RepID=A0A318S8D9_9DEIO|nr:VOC family protein [Deinococcus yavapaiensis]PYE54795.1 glyoxylase I family protein [Deinococcus yavapaiensis KR-236]
MKFSHVALNCANPRATADFYVSFFGFSLSRVFDLGEGKQLIFLRNGDALLELFQAEGVGEPLQNDGPAERGVLRHLAFQVDDVDATLTKLGSHAPVTLGPVDFDAFIPGWRTVWVRDPDGNIVEISQGYTDDPKLLQETLTGDTA